MSREGKKIAKSIQSAQIEVAEMTRRFFTAPNPLKILLPIILLSYLMGFMLSDFKDLNQTVYLGTVLFLLPAVVGALLSKPLAGALGGRLYLRRSMLLTFIDIIIIFGFVIVQVLFFKSIEISSYLIFAFASTSWLRHVVLVSTSNSSHLRSLPSTLAYPILGIFVVASVYPPFALKHLLLAIVLIAIFVLSAVLFLESANAPLRKAFGINGLSVLSYFLDRRHSSEENVKLEGLLESFCTSVNAHLGVLSFRTKDGIKLLMLVPSIHPGPFGYIGGSNLPSKLKEELRSNAASIFVPHGPCTHDFNPPTTKECRKISVRAKELLKDVEYSSDVSKFERKTNHANVCVQSFGGSALVLVSLAPNPTDDLDFSTGYAIREKVKDCGFRDAMVIDAHNCLLPGSGMVHFGTKTAMNIIETAQLSAKEAVDNRTKGLRIGVAEKGDLKIGSVGPMGGQVLVLEVQGQKTAYILLDGNNMVPRFRGELIKDVSGLVDEAEVLTTDNHVANITYGSFNPVGMHGRKELVELTKALVAQAVDDLEDAEVGLKTGIIEDFKVFGHESATRLATLISSTVSTLRIDAFLCLLLSYSLSVVAMMLTI